MEKAGNILKKGIIWIGLVIVGFLTVTSFFQKCVFHWDETETALPEFIYYEKNHFLLLILLTVILIIILKKYQGWGKWSLKKMKIFLFSYIIVASVAWIIISNSIPVADDMMIIRCAKEIAQGNYESLYGGGYLYNYTNQLGIVFVLKKLHLIFGNKMILAYRLGNVLALSMIYLSFIKIEELMKFGEKAMKISIICMAGFVVPIFYTTFVYGNMMGLAFSMGAIYYLIKYLDNPKIKNALIVLVLSVIACVFKTNYIIPMLAEAIVLFLNGIRKKRWFNLFLCIVLLAGNMGAQKGIEKYYEQSTGTRLTGASKLMWIAMAAEEGPFASGWYNLSFAEMMNEAAVSGEGQNEVAIKHLKHSAQQFQSGERNALGFYYRKIVSQWNEPTFEAFWINYHQDGQYNGTMSRILQSVYKGKMNFLLRNWMNWWHVIILLFSAIGLWNIRKKSTDEQCLLILVVIGGFFFHILWEGKSQYIWTYFILLIPFCALGMERISEKRKNI